jgi:outer membrane biosynthesis protein TonB
MDPKYLIRAAIAVSVIGHLALAVGVIFADARPFDPTPSEAIAVDIVTPEQAAPAKEATPEPPPQPPKPPDPFRLPELTNVEHQQQPQAAAQSSSQTSAAAPQPAQKSATAQAPQPPQPPPSQQASQQAALQPQQSPPQPSPQQAPPAAPQAQQGAAGAAEPDLTVKYGVMLGLPDGDGGATAFAKADIAPLDIAAFRRHLKTCSTLPDSIAPSDKVRIVLRALFTPDGKLVAPPALIEASASAKGPLLMQAAIKALDACQPYAMLPADKYKEWKVLDLAFTPQDFAG